MAELAGGPGAAEPAAAATEAGAAGAGAAQAMAGAAPVVPEAGAVTAEGAAVDAAAAEAAPEVTEPPSPREAIAPAVQQIRQRAGRASGHTPAGTIQVNAQAAAIRHPTEQLRGAAVATVQNLDEAGTETDTFQRESFRAALSAAIVAATSPTPTSEDQANRVISGGAQAASSSLQGQLGAQRDAAAGPLAAPAAAEVPPADVETPQPEVDLQVEQVGPPPAPVAAAPVVPAPLPPERLDYSEDRQATDSAMAESGVTQDQLERGNEPEFGQTLTARTEAEEHEAQVAATYRAGEAEVRGGAEQRAQGALAGGLAGMQEARTGVIGTVAGRQTGTMTRDEAERRRVTTTIEGIKNRTRTDVETLLTEMETEAARIFGEGLTAAEKAYRDTFEEEKGGVGTWLTTWGDDWEELIESSLATARSAYLWHVNEAIDLVADCVDAKLAAAKRRVTQGLAEVQVFVASLDVSLQAFGMETLAAVSNEFDEMTQSIDARKDALVESLTNQYKASYERMSAMEEELRAANKSLWQRVYDATIGLVKKILAFKDMLLSILAKAADVVSDIISDPIGFLGNLVAGVALGLENFIANIGTHLRKGLMDWLFGALGGAGITMPDSFDLKGIVSIVLQVLGLTYANFRARAVKIVGEPVVSALEQAAEVFKVIATEGIPGLWRFIQEKVADLKTMVLDAIWEFIQEKVIVAGITWIVGLLNPASAFFKACKAIYDIVMFFINRGSQIIDLVNAVIDSIGAIAKGSISVAATFVENALAKAIPVAIGFLASLLGLGDISTTIRNTIDKARAPVNDAIDWLIGKAVALVQAAGNLVVGVLGGRRPAGREEGAAEDRGSPQDAAAALLADQLGGETSVEEAETALPTVRTALAPQGLKSLELEAGAEPGEFEIFAEASPRRRIVKLVRKRVIVGVSASVTMREGESPLAELARPRGPGRYDFGESLNFYEVGADRAEALGGTGRAAPLPPVPQPPGTPARQGSQPSGGVVVEPTEGSGTLEILAWNTSAPVTQSNTSHAERQFMNWFEDRPRPWLNKVVRVEIHVDLPPSGMPDDMCPDCQADWANLARRFPEIEFATPIITRSSARADDLKTEVL
ncbi:phage tail protein [Georgenia muralis]